MNRFVGYCNFNKNLSSFENINTIKNLTNCLTNKGINNQDFYISKHLNIGNTQKQIIKLKLNGNSYTIVYSGKLYNAKDIREDLINIGYEFNRIL